MSAFCDIGFAIRAVRSARGISQERLATKLIGITRQHINGIECRRHVPTIQVCKRIARALDVTMPQLITIATAKE